MSKNPLSKEETPILDTFRKYGVPPSITIGDVVEGIQRRSQINQELDYDPNDTEEIEPLFNENDEVVVPKLRGTPKRR